MSDFAEAQVTRTGPTSATVHHGDDKAFFVKFYLREVPDDAATQQMGRPIFRHKDYVEIIPPGDKLTVWDREVTKRDMERWPEAWAAYKRQEEQTAQDGTPLKQLAVLSAQQVLALKNANFHTIEQLAAATDATISSMGAEGAMIQKWRAFARQYIDKAAQGVGERELLAKLEERDARIAGLEDQVNKLCARIEEMQRSTPGQVAQSAPVVPPPVISEALPEPEPVVDLSALADVPALSGEPEPVQEAPAPAPRRTRGPDKQPRKRGRPRKTPAPDAA